MSVFLFKNRYVQIVFYNFSFASYFVAIITWKYFKGSFLTSIVFWRRLLTSIWLFKDRMLYLAFIFQKLFHI